jgi:hypothetical protein
MAKKSVTNNFTPKRGKVSRPGVHSKSKTSKIKSSKNYQKLYQGQGK